MDITGEMLLEACNKSRSNVKRLLGTRVSEIDDVLQTACMKALQYAAKFEGKAQFSTWFYMIAKNEALMVHRSKHSRPFVELPYNLQSNRPNPEDTQMLKCRNRELVECLNLLSPVLRREMLLWSSGEQSDSNDNSCKARRFRARRELRVMLEVR